MDTMGYTSLFNELRDLFGAGRDVTDVSGSGISIKNAGFVSDVAEKGFINCSDSHFRENTTFTYPVFIPKDPASRNAILLLHGLNERNWVKYLSWAWSLSVLTGSYVILFPISFHINRSPAAWSNPREMSGNVSDRVSMGSSIKMASFANVALSRRLTEDPMRFFKSGYQTVSDLVKLMTQIRDGQHPCVPAGSVVNVFAYSIGAFLAQILFIGNPGGQFSRSKLFMFCGGSVFSNMKGTSRLIMDSMAFDRLYSYFLLNFENEISRMGPLGDYLNSDSTGLAFRSMIDYGRLAGYREKHLGEIGERCYCVSLSDDRVIPPAGIEKTMRPGRRKTSARIEILHLPYKYTHEVPFPVVGDATSKAVDDAFSTVFSKAAFFLSA